MGRVHFPEEQLITYLRVFLPEQRVSAMLDEIAEAAIRAEVDDELALFAIAHRLMDIDERRTRDVEAAVLVEEVGLATAEAAQILDLEVADVEIAVRRAWAEVQAGAADRAEQVEDPSEPVEDPSDRRALGDGDRLPQHPRRWWVVGLALVGLLGLGTAVFSEAGRARLNAVGLDPVVAYFVVVGLIGGGIALLWAGNATREETAPQPPIGTPVPGRPVARPAADHRRLAGTEAPTVDQSRAAARDGRSASAADPNGGPAAPSGR